MNFYTQSKFTLLTVNERIFKFNLSTSENELSQKSVASTRVNNNEHVNTPLDPQYRRRLTSKRDFLEMTTN